MHTKTVFSIAFLAAAAALFTNVGCSKNDTTTDRKSQKGEECQTTNDCADNLSCVPRAGNAGGGVCVTGEFKVAQTAQVCAVVECAQATDCCPTTNAAQCQSYQQGCNQGITSDCTYYNQFCKCDGSKYQCNNGSCKSVCSTNTDCLNGGTCQNGQCVQCTQDSNCTNGYVCNNGTCAPPCRNDADCPSFNTCDGNGHCSDTGGCTDDRECIAATKNVTAKCGGDGTCVVPCSTDLECGNPENYNFYSCIKNQCVYVGCKTDKECELYMGQTGNPTKGKIVCQDKPSQ